MNDGTEKSSWLDKVKKLFFKEADSRQELETFLEDAQAQDVIEQDALDMIKGVLEVAETRVRDVMVPRVQVRYIDEVDSLDKILDDMLEASHSRYPVFSEEDKLVGILLAKDVLRAVAKHNLNNHEDLRKLYREPEMVSESKRLNVLLRDFKLSRNHMALVVDEYGEFAGLVTIEDVLEQIVGEIEDEHDAQSEYIQKHLSGGFLVEAIVSVDEFNEFFHSKIESEQETLGGVALQQLGRIPEVSESFKLDKFTFKVHKADTRKVDSFIVTITGDENEENTTLNVLDAPQSE